MLTIVGDANKSVWSTRHATTLARMTRNGRAFQSRSAAKEEAVGWKVRVVAVVACSSLSQVLEEAGKDWQAARGGEMS